MSGWKSSQITASQIKSGGTNQNKSGVIGIEEAHFFIRNGPMVKLKYAEFTDAGRVSTEIEFPTAALGESEHDCINKFLESLAVKSKSINK